MVLRNGAPIGPTPVDDQFVYYGNYHFTLIKDGYTTLQVDQAIPTPWYQYVPLDFVTEALVPVHIEDVQRFHYVLQPQQATNPTAVIQEAEVLRSQGQAIGVPPPPAPPPPPPALAVPPAPPVTTGEERRPGVAGQ